MGCPFLTLVSFTSVFRYIFLVQPLFVFVGTRWTASAVWTISVTVAFSILNTAKVSTAAIACWKARDADAIRDDKVGSSHVCFFFGKVYWVLDCTTAGARPSRLIDGKIEALTEPRIFFLASVVVPTLPYRSRLCTLPMLSSDGCCICYRPMMTSFVITVCPSDTIDYRYCYPTRIAGDCGKEKRIISYATLLCYFSFFILVTKYFASYSRIGF